MSEASPQHNDAQQGPRGLRKYSALKQTAGASYLFVAAFARLPLSMVPLAVLAAVSAVTGSLAVAGIASGAAALAEGISAPVYGTLSDRFGQRRVLVPVAIAQVIVLISFGLLVARVSPPMIVLLSAVAGATMPQISAMSRARWMTLLPRQSLSVAFAFEGILDELNFLVGPILVGVVAVAFGPTVTLSLPGVIGVICVLGFALHPTERAVRQRIVRARTKDSGATVDVSGADISGADASSADASSADASSADISGADIRSAGKDASVDALPTDALPADALPTDAGAKGISDSVEDVHSSHESPAAATTATRHGTQRTLFILVVISMLAIGVFFGGSQTALTAVATERSVDGLGAMLYGVMAVGSVICTMFMVYVPPRVPLGVRWLVAGVGLLLGTVGMALALDSLGLLVVVLVFAGCFQGPLLLTVFDGVATVTSAQSRGATMALMTSCNVLGVAGGAALAGMLGDAGGAHACFWVVGIASFILMIAGFFVWRLPDSDESQQLSAVSQV